MTWYTGTNRHAAGTVQHHAQDIATAIDFDFGPCQSFHFHPVTPAIPIEDIPVQDRPLAGTGELRIADRFPSSSERDGVYFKLPGEVNSLLVEATAKR